MLLPFLLKFISFSDRATLIFLMTPMGKYQTFLVPVLLLSFPVLCAYLQMGKMSLGVFFFRLDRRIDLRLYTLDLTLWPAVSICVCVCVCVCLGWC